MRVRLRYKQEGQPWQGGFELSREHAERIIADVVRTGSSKYDVFEISAVSCQIVDNETSTSQKRP